MTNKPTNTCTGCGLEDGKGHRSTCAIWNNRDRSKDPKEPVKLTIEFTDRKVMEHFATWLCESGEQEYWSWMEVREEEEPGDITATTFDYHGAKGKGKFLCDDTIRTYAGRLTSEQEEDD